MFRELYRHFIYSQGICTDSRYLKKGQLFFALKGDFDDGHQYIDKALEKKAQYCIIDNPNYQQSKCILVDNVLKTLQNLACYHRDRYPIPLIAITGSNGKTTTRDLVFKVLSSTYECIVTQGNFNNHIGVPLTLLRIKPHTEIIILEMGANHIGEIAELCQIAKPNFGLVTNINKAHLEGFGSLEGVKIAKGELYNYLETRGKVFVNLRQKTLVDISKQRTNLQTIFYGSQNSFFYIQYIDKQPFVCYKIEEKTYNSCLFGAYNFENILSALTIAQYFDVPLDKATGSIESYKPVNNRSQWIEKNTNTYILDAYNANPDSMYQAIKSFKYLEAQKKVIILGDMFELGKYILKEHQNIIDLLLNFDFETCFFCGENFYKLKCQDYHFFKNFEHLIIGLQNYSFDKKTYFLIKGSRNMRLERLITENIL